MFKLASVTALLIASFTISAEAGDKMRGKWNGKIRSTIEIINKDPILVRYCFKRDCNNHSPSGSLNKMTFSFAKNGNFPGAKMVLTKVDAGYSGTYQQNNSSAVSSIIFK